MSHIDAILDKFGLANEKTLEEIIYVGLIVAIALFLGWAVRKVVVFIARKAVQLHPTDVGNELLEQKTFSKCSHIIPPLVFLALIPFAFETDSHTLKLIDRGVIIYFMIMVGIGI